MAKKKSTSKSTKKNAKKSEESSDDGSKVKEIELPDENWVIDLSLDGDIEEKIDLIDVKEIFGSYLAVRKKFFDDLLNIAPTARHYGVGKAIDQVLGIDGKDWTKNSWLLVMGKEMSNKASFWMLFKREQNLSGSLVAIGPEELAKSVLKLFPKDDDAKHEYFKKIMIWLTVEPAKWKNVALFVPNWL